MSESPIKDACFSKGGSKYLAFLLKANLVLTEKVQNNVLIFYFYLQNGHINFCDIRTDPNTLSGLVLFRGMILHDPASNEQINYSYEWIFSKTIATPPFTRNQLKSNFFDVIIEEMKKFSVPQMQTPFQQNQYHPPFQQQSNPPFQQTQYQSQNQMSQQQSNPLFQSHPSFQPQPKNPPVVPQQAQLPNNYSNNTTPQYQQNNFSNGTPQQQMYNNNADISSFFSFPKGDLSVFTINKMGIKNFISNGNQNSIASKILSFFNDFNKKVDQTYLDQRFRKDETLCIKSKDKTKDSKLPSTKKGDYIIITLLGETNDSFTFYNGTTDGNSYYSLGYKLKDITGNFGEDLNKTTTFQASNLAVADSLFVLASLVSMILITRNISTSNQSLPTGIITTLNQNGNATPRFLQNNNGGVQYSNTFNSGNQGYQPFPPSNNQAFPPSNNKGVSAPINQPFPPSNNQPFPPPNNLTQQTNNLTSNFANMSINNNQSNQNLVSSNPYGPVSKETIDLSKYDTDNFKSFKYLCKDVYVYCSRVIDGDTVKLLILNDTSNICNIKIDKSRGIEKGDGPCAVNVSNNNCLFVTKESVRLYGIDASESIINNSNKVTTKEGQICKTVLESILMKLNQQKEKITADFYGLDAVGRLMAELKWGNVNINQFMLTLQYHGKPICFEKKDAKKEKHVDKLNKINTDFLMNDRQFIEELEQITKHYVDLFFKSKSEGVINTPELKIDHIHPDVRSPAPVNHNNPMNGGQQNLGYSNQAPQAPFIPNQAPVNQTQGLPFIPNQAPVNQTQGLPFISNQAPFNQFNTSQNQLEIDDDDDNDNNSDDTW